MTNEKWVEERTSPNDIRRIKVNNIVYRGRTPFQDVVIADTESYGRCLFLDGMIQSAEADEYVYHEILVHPPLILQNNPRKVFIVGAGEGSTIREVLLYPSVELIEAADIDRDVVDLCKKYLPNHHQGAFDDKRVRVIFNDGKKVLVDSKERYDAIIIDLTDPLAGGPSYLLYTAQFYELVKEKLTREGGLSVQSGQADILNYTRSFSPIFNTLRKVFGDRVFPYVTHMESFHALWGFNLVSNIDPLSLEPKEIDSRIARLNRRLRYYDGETHKWMFILPTYLREGLEKERRLITDESPISIA